jgi:non-lysosomal glucosylceramidase
MTADGRWRQWEAYDCVNIDSVHNDGERHLPYIFFFPETTRIKMAAWAKTAQPDGMIVEQLSTGCTGAVPQLDQPAGRRMSDVSSMLIV